jgi:glycosyltransferase involved in cell wall biosynthesis
MAMPFLPGTNRLSIEALGMSSSWKDNFSLSQMTGVVDKGGTFPLTEGMLLYWNIDSQLQEAFDIRNIEGRAGYAAWLLVYQNDLPGLHIADHARSFPSFFDSVKQPVSPDGTFFLPALLYAVWKSREDLCDKFDLSKERDRSSLCGNLLLTNPAVAPFVRMLEDYLAAPVPEAGGLPRVLYALWMIRSDLREAFPFGKSDVEQQFILWTERYGCEEYPWLISILTKYYTLAEEAASEVSISSVSTDPATGTNVGENIGHLRQGVNNTVLPQGVNLFGYAFAPSGLGMDLRMVGTALDHAQIPFCVINCPRVTPSPSSELEFLARQSDKPLYNTTLFCLPCGEVYRAMCMLGEDYFAGQYLIGQMPWEFAVWPSVQVPILCLLHEVWCLSGFIKKALAPVCPVPLRQVRRPVIYEPQPTLSRSDFGLPDGAYLFLFMWDGLSCSSRKNPEAVVNAFQLAFGTTVRDVRLVLKTQHSLYDKRSKIWSSVIAADDRLHVLEGSMTQQQIWGLYASCDAYVSLHRSEGFGLSLAEAMLAEKPVIASAYSGNLDFCTETTALLVPGRSVPVSSGAYPLAGGQEWFDADIHEAARLMRFCYENRSETVALARAGRVHIETWYNIETCAEHYGERLFQIWRQNF